MSGSERSSGAVVALKRLADAKTRFAGIPAVVRRELVWCMALDAIGALTASVTRVVLVTDEPTARTGLRRAGLPVTVLPEPPAAADGQESLNRALSAGIDRLGQVHVVLAVLADLPALRSASVARILDEQARAGCTLLVPDSLGIGTSMLVGSTGQVRPQFGGASAQRHREGGVRDVPDLDKIADARADVDDIDGLRAAARLGLGRWTADLVSRRPELLTGH